MAKKKEEKLSLEAIKSRIIERGVKWRATVTSISKLSVKEQAIRLGLVPTTQELEIVSKLRLDKPDRDPSESLEKFGRSNLESAGLPTSIEWRNVNGIDWTTSIKDQNGCGSCVAFGAVAALEPLLKIRTFQDPNWSIDLSEAHLLFCGGGSCSGWHMNAACGYLQKHGVPDEACFPYSKGLETNSCTTCSDWKSRIDYTKILSWSNTKDVNQMKFNLVNNGPQITGMAVYTDFFYYESGIYSHIEGGLEGYHCVAVVGYNDTDGCWICKNSWGTGWGENGWFRIAYGECGIQDVFGMWNMQVRQRRRKS